MMMKYLIPFFVLLVLFQLAFVPVPVHGKTKKKPRPANITPEETNKKEKTDVSVEIEDYSTVNYEDLLGTHYLFEIISKIFDTFIQKWNSDKPRYIRGRETVQELWFTLERILKDPVGSKTIQLVFNKITDILTDPQAHDTLIKISDTLHEILIKGEGLQNITKIMHHIQSNKQLQTTIGDITNLFFNERSQINSVPQMRHSYGALKSWIKREVASNTEALLNEKQSKQSSNTDKLENTATNALTKSKSNLSQLMKSPSLNKASASENSTSSQSKLDRTQSDLPKYSKSDSFPLDLTSSNSNSVDQLTIPKQSSPLNQQTPFKSTFRPFQQLPSSASITNQFSMKRFGSFGNSGFSFSKPDTTL